MKSPRARGSRAEAFIRMDPLDVKWKSGRMQPPVPAG